MVHKMFLVYLSSVLPFLSPFLLPSPLSLSPPFPPPSEVTVSAVLDTQSVDPNSVLEDCITASYCIPGTTTSILAHQSDKLRQPTVSSFSK